MMVVAFCASHESNYDAGFVLGRGRLFGFTRRAFLFVFGRLVLG